ncbi:hypothetical protein CEXT_477081 [Caerostris extrusa]|uniref:AB hydrolase-1 domain-containing protein n=1 Tax=Caerostris extrusa TaxID=172846 RepID=A0AAV4XW76_CAEEX|nr:hypothetical protein CEXT_477081 [Caerostris extrusa]
MYNKFPTMTFARRLVTISSLVICVWIVIGIIIYRSTSFTLFSDNQIKIPSETKPVGDEIEACKRQNQKLSPLFWRRVNYYRKEIPEALSSSATKIAVHSNFTTFHVYSKIHYLYAKPDIKKNLSVLLLHGQSYTSETWDKLRTIQHIAAFGYYAVAVDLPGYGDSPDIKKLNRTGFLTSIIDSLNMENVVIISPSMSGSFSMEFLIGYSTKMVGFVPVSPISSKQLSKHPCKTPINFTSMHFDKDCQKLLPFLGKKSPPNLSCIKVPTLVVYGEQDKSKSSAKLCLLPNSQGAEIPNGEHAAYLSNPELWHKLLYNYLDTLNDVLPCI